MMANCRNEIGGTAASRCRREGVRQSKNQTNQRGNDKVSKLAGNRPWQSVQGRLMLKSDPAPVRVRQMSPPRSNCWRWKRNQTKPSEFDPEVHILPYNLENPLWSGMLCKDFSPGGQCWNRNCDCLLLCLTFFTPIIWGFCCWPGLCLTYNHHIGHWRLIMRIIWVFQTGC